MTRLVVQAPSDWLPRHVVQELTSVWLITRDMTEEDLAERVIFQHADHPLDVRDVEVSREGDVLRARWYPRRPAVVVDARARVIARRSRATASTRSLVGAGRPTPAYWSSALRQWVYVL